MLGNEHKTISFLIDKFISDSPALDHKELRGIQERLNKVPISKYDHVLDEALDEELKRREEEIEKSDNSFLGVYLSSIPYGENLELDLVYYDLSGGSDTFKSGSNYPFDIVPLSEKEWEMNLFKHGLPNLDTRKGNRSLVVSDNLKRILFSMIYTSWVTDYENKDSLNKFYDKLCSVYDVFSQAIYGISIEESIRVQDDFNRLSPEIVSATENVYNALGINFTMDTFKSMNYMLSSLQTMNLVKVEIDRVNNLTNISKNPLE